MASQQPQLQLGRLLGRNRLGDEPAEAGVDAVCVVSDLGLEEGARRRRPLSATGAQRNLPAPDRYVPDVPDREVVTRELDHGRHGASLVPATPTLSHAMRAARPAGPAHAPPLWGRDIPSSHASRELRPRVCRVRAEMVTAAAEAMRAPAMQRGDRKTTSQARRCHSSTLSSSRRSRWKLRAAATRAVTVGSPDASAGLVTPPARAASKTQTAGIRPTSSPAPT